MKLSAYLSIALLAAGMSATVSCSQENEPDLTASSVQGLTISISDSGYATTDGTRAIDQAYKTTFTDGDAIGVFAVRSGKVVEKISNRKFTFKEGNWELEGEPIEYKGTEFKYMKFFAYYPYSENVKFDAGKWDAATQTGDPFESYVNTWNIQSDQSGDNYTKQHLMTSSSDAEGEPLQGKVAFTMTHRMSLVVLEMPKLTYDFTNPGLDDYQMNVSPADFQINGKAAHPHYDAATHTYLALVNPGKDFTIGGYYTGTQLMEYSAKGNLQGGNAKKYTIKDAGKISYTLAVGDYFCADGSLVSKDAETVPANVVGIVAYAGNPQPHVMAPDACSDVQDALFRDYPSASHGLILALNNAALEDGSTTSQYHSGKSGTYDTWFDDDAEWAGKFVYCNTSRNGSLKNDVLAMYPAFFGYNNTVLMTMVTEEGKGSPSTCDHACKFIQAYRSAVELPASASPWYLPSAKELQQVADNLSQLNSSLTKAGGQELVSTTAQSGHYWTSVLRSEVYQWTHGMEGGLYTVLAERGSRAGQFRMMAAF